jgi:hypothetical protein
MANTAVSIGIDQVIYDPVGECAYAKPNQILDQDTTYLLLVDSNVKDAKGQRLKTGKDYSDCVAKSSSTYCRMLSQALGLVNGGNGHGNAPGGIIAASLFTTMSATQWLQQARAAVHSGSIPGAGTLYGPMSTFNMADITSMVWMPDSGAAGVNYDQAFPLSVLSGIDKVSFGIYLSPLYLNTSGPQAGAISTTPTNTPISAPSALVPVSFHLFLPPASSVPGGKIPVIVFGHGLGDSQFGASTFAASTWAQKGFATLAIEVTGHGYGPLGSVQVVTKSGTSTIPTPGRGIQFSPTAPIGPTDGCILPGAVGTRDCLRQTVVDLFTLLNAIRGTQGLGLNLDTSRIYYAGQSLGALYGTLFAAVEPNIAGAAINSGGGSQADIGRLSPIVRQLGAAYLSGFTPSLFNVPPAPSEAYFHDSFNDEYAYRGQVVTDKIPGALAIQAAFEQTEWLGMLGDPLSYAAHLKTAPLPGVAQRPILVQFGLGDLEVPNPTESAFVRTAQLQRNTWMLRTDLAAAIEPQLLGVVMPGVPYPIYPHRFLSNPTLFDPSMPPLETAIAVAAQKQIADFFKWGSIPDPNQYFNGGFVGLKLFEQPNPLPGMLNFLQIQP